MRNRNLMFIKVGGTDRGGWKSIGEKANSSNNLG